MLLNKKHNVLMVLAVLAAAPAVQADEIIFFQDFGCTGATGSKAGGGVCDGGATVPQSWTTITNPDSEGGITKRSGPSGGLNEVVRADSSTATVSNLINNNVATPSNFSVTGRNWDIHDGSQITRISGYRSASNAPNNNMQGNMLGMVKSSSTLPGGLEDNYYQISGLQLGSAFESLTLTFDFDSYIWADGDGFGVAISTNGGGNFDILNPLAASAMQYRNLPTGSGDFSLDTLLGETVGAPLRGFDGAATSSCTGTGCTRDKAGVAMFDLSSFAGQTISLRFAYAANGLDSGSAEGINIDNIKVTGVCDEGTSGPNCEPPDDTDVPEPASLGLALLGLTVALRRKMRRA